MLLSMTLIDANNASQIVFHWMCYTQYCLVTWIEKCVALTTFNSFHDTSVVIHTHKSVFRNETSLWKQTNKLKCTCANPALLHINNNEATPSKLAFKTNDSILKSWNCVTSSTLQKYRLSQAMHAHEPVSFLSDTFGCEPILLL